MQAERLTIKQTHTGYWTVQRGDVQVASSTTRRGAESERELLVRLALRAGARRRDRSGQRAQRSGTTPR